MSSDSGIVLYYSSVAGSVASEKNTDRIRALLTAAKLKFTEVDVSLAENASQKNYMKDHSKLETKTSLPQVFYNGEYKGNAEVLDEWNEFGELKVNLGGQ